MSNLIMRLQQFRGLIYYDHRIGDGAKIAAGEANPVDGNETQMTMLKPA